MEVTSHQHSLPGRRCRWAEGTGSCSLEHAWKEPYYQGHPQCHHKGHPRCPAFLYTEYSASMFRSQQSAGIDLCFKAYMLKSELPLFRMWPNPSCLRECPVNKTEESQFSLASDLPATSTVIQLMYVPFFPKDFICRCVCLHV